MTAMKTWNFGRTADYPAGPWSTEPDKAQWIDDATGLDCLIVRGPVGALCGYVGVPPEHPLHGVDYSRCPEGCGEHWCEHSPESRFDVHGGLTYSDSCRENEDGSGICHVPEPGRPADVWWFGFDCSFDLAPYMVDRALGFGPAVYRDVEYVRGECESLARQLAAVTA